MMNATTPRPRSPRARAKASALGVAVLAITLMAGCSSTVTGSGTAVPASPSVSASPTQTPTPTPDPCGPATGQEAAAAGIAALSVPAGLESSRWDAAGANFTGYDPCADLSWSVVTLEFATVSTPAAVLLFHRGEYIGTATETAYGFTPLVERTADDAIRVTYRFNQGAESNAEASGRAVATFTWNAETNSVEMAGDLPPAL